MIYDALELIRLSLENYIREVEQPLTDQDIVILDNIAMASELGGGRDDMNEHVVMSLVNLQEETTLKNAPHYRMENGRTIYQNPPVNLNLFVLFSILHIERYEVALRRLSRVVEFFQWKKEFSFTTGPGPNGPSRDVRALSDLYTLNFDQLNHLWGVLGGKQVPFVMYRTRLVSLAVEKPQAESTPILENVAQGLS